MTASPDPLPDITRPDAGLATFSEWTVGTPERQQAAMAAWVSVPWPRGMLSHTCFASTDGTTLRHHSQWTDDEARRAFWRTDASERVRAIDDAVPGIDRHDLADYELYRSYRNSVSTDAAAPPGCIVIVTIDFDDPDQHRQRRWIDAVLDALGAEPEPIPGLISAHFHWSTDGTQVINYAEWTSEQAHKHALDNGPDGIAQTDLPEWRRVVDFPGVTDLGQFKRYRQHRNVAVSPIVAASADPAGDDAG